MGKKIPDEPRRIAIPIVMLEGNFELLQEHDIRGAAIGIRRYNQDDFGEAYVLTFRWESDAAEAEARKLGFRTTRGGRFTE